MALQSSIEWTESTWNPVTGCSKISPGCKHCYAERMSKRLMAMGQPNYQRGFQLTLHQHAVELPLTWRKPQVIFVNSMSDLFHKEVPTAFIQRVFDVMAQANWHQFQVLTKRAGRLAKVSGSLIWPDHVWMGVSVESDAYKSRIDLLREVPAKIRFLSIEPMIAPVTKLDLRGMHWVIVGGESGPGARPMDQDWVREVRDQCLEQDVPFFFKQWGGLHKKKNGRLIDGRTWDEMPRQVYKQAM
jgi:protein gp37